ncbi:unnamed protein product [Adineta steineri]|uniref:Uncharacterized protein n=1 Tax=Adineta steineri TaxID=433720 RepID=A0A818U1T5_9BILA|nr:unnamed protein product [Adineta steineri]CAF3689878.1 unnamed protein product [Adineta steineri]
MYSSVSKLDQDIACLFLNAPSNIISYRPVSMRTKQNPIRIESSQSICNKDKFIDDNLLQSHSNTKIIPMYYDVIIDTVTDYDIFYPVAKQIEKYGYNSINSRYHVQRLDEHAVSINFPHGYDSTSNLSNQDFQYEHFHPVKNVRFNDKPTWIPYSRNNTENPSISLEQYYFYPEMVPHVDNEQSSGRYLTAPFFWFRPVLNHDYAICIPSSRPSLHAYISPLFNPYSKQNSTPNPVQL